MLEPLFGGGFGREDYTLVGGDSGSYVGEVFVGVTNVGDDVVLVCGSGGKVE